MFRIALRSFWGLCRRSISYFFLTLLCLSCIFISLLFLQERGYYSYVQSASSPDESQTLFFACDDHNVIHNVYKEILATPDIPAIEALTLSNGQYAGIYWNRDLNDDVWYTPYGRFFTKEEMDSGANVALLATSYIGNLPYEERDHIWNTGIKIHDISYEAIGNYFFEWFENIPEEAYQLEATSALVTLPLKTFLSAGMNASHFRCVFSQALTKSQFASVHNIIQRYDNVYHLSFPPINHSRAVSSFIRTVAPSSLIILLAMISLVDVVINWIKKDYVRYKAYLICGAKETQIALIILVNVAILASAAFVCASFITAVLTNIATKEILLPLPWYFQLLVYIGLLLITLIIAFLKSFRLVFSRKILTL